MKKSIIVVGLFLLYVLLVPRIVAIRMPCLMPVVPEASEYIDCTFTQASNNFLMGMFLGWVVVIGAFVLTTKTVKELSLFAAITAIIIVAGYYMYIRSIESKVTNAPVYLDTLYKSKGPEESPSP